MNRWAIVKCPYGTKTPALAFQTIDVGKLEASAPRSRRSPPPAHYLCTPPGLNRLVWTFSCDRLYRVLPTLEIAVRLRPCGRCVMATTAYRPYRRVLVVGVLLFLTSGVGVCA